MRNIWFVVLVWLSLPYFAWMYMLYSEYVPAGTPFTLIDLVMIILLTPFIWATGYYYFAIHGWLFVYFVVTGVPLYLVYRWWKSRKQ